MWRGTGLLAWVFVVGAKLIVCVHKAGPKSQEACIMMLSRAFRMLVQLLLWPMDRRRQVTSWCQCQDVGVVSVSSELWMSCGSWDGVTQSLDPGAPSQDCIVFVLCPELWVGFVSDQKGNYSHMASLLPPGPPFRSVGTQFFLWSSSPSQYTSCCIYHKSSGTPLPRITPTCHWSGFFEATHSHSNAQSTTTLLSMKLVRTQSWHQLSKGRCWEAEGGIEWGNLAEEPATP